MTSPDVDISHNARSQAYERGSSPLLTVYMMIVSSIESVLQEKQHLSVQFTQHATEKL